MDAPLVIKARISRARDSSGNPAVLGSVPGDRPQREELERIARSCLGAGALASAPRQDAPQY
jgi:hypothetical protein